MSTKFYLNGKKVSKKTVTEIIGSDRLKKMIKESKETFFEDPYIAIDYFLGSEGMLSICFE